MATVTTITCDRCKAAPKIIEQNISIYWRHRTGIVVDLCEKCRGELDTTMKTFFNTTNFKEYRRDGN